jgi:putative methionine-R-sulfoxide reductase with GAF domain
MAVFDIDSTQISAFDSTDQDYLSNIVDWIRPIYEQHTIHHLESVYVNEYA